MSCSSAARRRSPRVRGVEPERRGDAVGDLRHAGAVARGVGRLGVDDARERLGDAIHPVGVGELDPVGGLDALHVGRCEAGPERAVALEHADGVDERGVEPGAAPGAGDVDRGRGPALLPEDLHRLRQARDPGQQRDLLAGPVARMALPVPMLEQLADRGGGLLVEADPARDVGAARAAHPLELRDAAVAHGDDGAQVARALAQRRAGRHVALQVAERQRGAVDVDQPALALDLQVVGAERLGSRPPRSWSTRRP